MIITPKAADELAKRTNHYLGTVWEGGVDTVIGQFTPGATTLVQCHWKPIITFAGAVDCVGLDPVQVGPMRVEQVVRMPTKL